MDILFNVSFNGDNYVFALSGEKMANIFEFSVKVSVNGVEKTDFGVRWNGTTISADDFYAVALAAYLRDDANVTFDFVSDEIKAFKEANQIYSDFVFKGRRVPKFAFSTGGDKLPLRAVDAGGCAYYSDDNGEFFMLVDATGRVATDYENFFTDALVAAGEDGELIFADAETKKWLASYYDVSVA